MSVASALPSVLSSAPLTGQSIGAVAAELGISVHTLRYYERAGLLEVPRRGGVRSYGPAASLTDFAGHRNAHRLIRRCGELARQGEHTQTERRALLVNHRGDVQARLTALKTDLGAIDRKIELYDQQHKENR